MTAASDPGRARVHARLVILALALRAMQGVASAWDLDQAQAVASAPFAPGDPLPLELARFAALFPSIRRNPDLLKAAGDQLFRAVERSTWPRPQGRRDLEG